MESDKRGTHISNIQTRDQKRRLSTPPAKPEIKKEKSKLAKLLTVGSGENRVLLRGRETDKECEKFLKRYCVRKEHSRAAAKQAAVNGCRAPSRHTHAQTKKNPEVAESPELLFS